MKKNYTKPNMLCEKIDSYNIITETSTSLSKIGDFSTDEADGDVEVLAPKRHSIWDDED